jgi:hypothetical protein
MLIGVFVTQLSGYTEIPSLKNSVGYVKLLSLEQYNCGMPVTDYAAHPFSAQNKFPKQTICNQREEYDSLLEHMEPR